MPANEVLILIAYVIQAQLSRGKGGQDFLSRPSSTFLLYVYKQGMLWQDCMFSRACLGIGFSHMSWVSKSNEMDYMVS